MFRPMVPQMLENRPNPFSIRIRDLWCAVLHQAMDDLRGRPDETDKYSKHQKAIRKNNALAWFQSKRNEPKSFLWICDVLNIDAIKIRDRLTGVNYG